MPAAPGQISSTAMVTALKAAAEPTRLRILALLATSALSVKDLTRILGQSQPRLSRHLKLLTEAGLVERAPEGSWVYFHLADGPSSLAREMLSRIDAADPTFVRDRQRAVTVRQERQAEAQSYFAAQAANWDRIRALHVAESEVEAAMRDALPTGKIDLLVDLGTGTGRMLELFADRYTRALGFDLSHAMLAYARSKLDASGIAHAQVRQGDIFDVPLADGVAGAVVLHQILHFLADPPRAIEEAARILEPGGTLILVDFAPHELEFLREQHAHERLGFSDAQIRQWLEAAGLSAVASRHLNPAAGEGSDKLTVSLWTAAKPLCRPAATPAASQLERTP